MQGAILDPNLEFLKRCFGSYYKNLDLEPPSRFTRREWGFFLFGARNMIRHLQFQTAADLQDFLWKRVPMHSYCSSAYYKDPAITPMAVKEEGWMGADLIFDLDADHLKDAEKMSYTEQLANVKVMVQKLLFDFLLPDFGFDEKYVKVFFSGGRGYHIHITDPAVLEFTSKDRQEIVDYLEGTGLNEDFVIPKEFIGKKEFQNHVIPIYRRRMEDENFPGWKGRIRKGASELLDKLSAVDEDGAIEVFSEIRKDPAMKGLLGEKTARGLYKDLFSRTPEGGTVADEIRRTGVLDNLRSDKDRNVFFKAVVTYSRLNLAGETDEPVTKDIKRLLRMPLSLHGKTGLRVTRIDLDGIRDFEPLRDTLVFSDKPVKVEVVKPVDMKIGPEHFKLEPGETELPLYSTVFLVARRNVKIA